MVPAETQAVAARVIILSLGWAESTWITAHKLLRTPMSDFLPLLVGLVGLVVFTATVLLAALVVVRDILRHESGNSCGHSSLPSVSRPESVSRP